MKTECKKIMSGDTILALYITAKQSGSAPLSFYSEENDFIQVGEWNYNAGTILHRHYHNEVSRTVTLTQEVIVVRAGKVSADIYDDDQTLVETIILEAGDILILLAGGHGYEILSDNTQVIEIKNGPYLGAEIDRTRF